VTQSFFAAGAAPRPVAASYEPGVCNIGPAEIARRRRAGHVGVIATIGLLAILLVLDTPPAARLLLVIPAAVAASGYLQAWLRFCAGFGSRGIVNFGPLGESESVVDPEARARDRRRARQIGLASLAVGVVVGVATAIAPLP
jgi:hypothetical protein